MEYANIILPKAIENLALPDPQLANYYNSLENRSFWIDSEVDSFLLEVIKYITYWNKQDRKTPIKKRKPIKLFFFSPGGELDVNYAVIDAIKASKTPIYGINVGSCCSAAAYIYLACHKRFMFPHAYFIYHQGSGQLAGTYEQICAQLDDYQKQVEELANYMVENTNYSAEEVCEKIVGEWYIRKEEAIQKGVAHKVIESLEELF